MHTLLRFAAAAVMALPALGFTAQVTPNYHLGIANPADGSTVFSDSGDVLVRATVAPELANGDKVELLVDGLPAAAPSTTLEFPLSGIARGLHLLQVITIDSTGNVGSISPSNTLYVWQASKLFPNRR